MTEPNAAQRVGNTAAALAGDAKKGVGQVIGHDEMQRTGEQERKEAEAKNKVSEGKQEAQGQMDNVKGNVKEGLGNLTGDDQKKAEGKGDQAKGDANQKASDLNPLS